MLAAKGLLEDLSKEEHVENYKDCNDDFNFGEVLDFCNDGNINKHGNILRYSNGQEKTFSFND